MKLAVSNIAWDTSQNEHVFAHMKQLGFEYLEIAPTKLADQPYTAEGIACSQSFLAHVKESYGIQLASMQAILYGVSDRLFASEQERDRLFDYICQAIDYAQAVGCPHLVFGSPKNRIMEDASQYPLAVEFFTRVADYAQEKGVYFSIEANPALYGTNFINTHKEAFDLVRVVNHPHFGVIVDVGSMIANEETVAFLEEHIQQINHIHISEPYLVPIEQRDLHRDLFALLHRLSYDKVVSIEMQQPEDVQVLLNAMAYVADVKADVKKG